MKDFIVKIKNFIIKILMDYDRFAYKLGDKLFDLGRFVKRVYLSKKPPQLKLSLKLKPAWVSFLLKIPLVQVVKYVVIIFLIFTVVASLVPLIPIPGNFKSLVVMSGSMEPTIHVGSVAIIKPSEDVRVGDIVTVKNPKNSNTSFTHRIVSIEKPPSFAEASEGKEIIKTKGDANDFPDSWELTKNDIVGKFLFAVPFLGYAVHFAKTPRGFIFLIIFPAILIILDELRVIKDELEKKYALKYGENAKEKKKAKNAKLVVSLTLLFGATVFALGATQAYFLDTAEREPDGKDTGSASDFVERTNPSPGN